MDRPFLDANILFSAAYRADAGLLQLWKLHRATLCTSRYALEEARVNLSESLQLKRLERRSESLLLFEAEEQKVPDGVLLPGKDIPIISAAITARATHLLTGDVKHFGAYFGRKIGGVLVTLPGDYLRTRRR